MRTAETVRKTTETDIALKIDIDGKGIGDIDTGCGFLDHMLELFARHGSIDMQVKCKGDVNVDYHHTVEDISICLGRCFREALGDCRGIARYGDMLLPMDEALILAAVDISGRGRLCFDCQMPTEKVGDFDTELAMEFFEGFAMNAGITLHIKKLAGANSHHIIEGIFKAVSRALRKACQIQDKYKDEIPSTKGVLL